MFFQTFNNPNQPNLRSYTNLEPENDISEQFLSHPAMVLRCLRGRLRMSTVDTCYAICQWKKYSEIQMKSVNICIFAHDMNIDIWNKLMHVAPKSPLTRNSIESVGWPRVLRPSDRASNILHVNTLTQWLLQKFEYNHKYIQGHHSAIGAALNIVQANTLTLQIHTKIQIHTWTQLHSKIQFHRDIQIHRVVVLWPIVQ